jgi:Tfp pilus assembly protein PilF
MLALRGWTMETLMRLTPVTLALAIAAATVASAGHGQKADDQIDVRSVALQRQGEALTASGQYDAAIDALETALVVDPRNRGAYVGLARVAQNQKLPGKAVGLYDEALNLEPNDVSALAGQGEALVQRGAVERAKQNLAKLETLCNTPCPQAMTLAAAIEKGPPVEVAAAKTPEADTPTNN